MSKKKKHCKLTGYNLHHTRPKSRGGTDACTVTLPISWHNKWHDLFYNLTIDEVHDYIEIVMVPGKVWTIEKLTQLFDYVKQHRGSK